MRVTDGTPNPNELNGNSTVQMVESLTARETEVLGLIAKGKSNRDIARDLALSPHTAKYHVSSVFGKLGASNRSHAAYVAQQLGLINPPTPPAS